MYGHLFIYLFICILNSYGVWQIVHFDVGLELSVAA